MSDELEDLEERPREVRSFAEIVEPEGSRGSWHDLPHLLLESVRLAWSAGRRELLLTATLQVVASLGIAAQLFAGKAVLTSIVGALAGLQPLLVPLVLLSYVPLWIASSRNSRDFYKFSWGMTPKDRQRYYLQHLVLDRDPAKELRVFRLAPYLRRRYDELYEHRIAELRGVARRRSLRSLAAALASAAVTAVAAGGLAWFYVSGRMSLAAT